MIVLRGCQACKTELETVSNECQVTKGNREEGSYRCQVSGFSAGFSVSLFPPINELELRDLKSEMWNPEELKQ